MVASSSRAGGGITGYVSLRKLPGERRATEVDIAAKIREVYDGIISDLREQVERQGARLEVQEKRLKEQSAEILDLRWQLEQARERIIALEAENELLRDEKDK